MPEVAGKRTSIVILALGGTLLAYSVWNAIYRVWEDSVLEGNDLTWSSFFDMIGTDIWLLAALGVALVAARGFLQWRL
jgi:hypothetical protein